LQGSGAKACSNKGLDMGHSVFPSLNKPEAANQHNG
jgi:hypothetical protein